MVLATPPSACALTLRVGVPDFQPDIYLQSDGRPGGVLGDLLNEIAAHEGWTLDARACHWTDCLAQLRSGSIDLLPDIQRTPQRAQSLDFHQIPVLSRSSQIYAHEGVDLDTWKKLDGKRIAVLAGSIQHDMLQSKLLRMQINATLVTVENLENGFNLVNHNAADATVADHVFGALAAPRYHLSATPIKFETSEIFYAARAGLQPVVLTTIDRYLEAWKADSNSVYYRILHRWGQAAQEFQTPWYSHWSILAALFMLFLAAAGYGRYQQTRKRVFRSFVQAKQNEINVITNQQNDLQERVHQISHFDRLTDLPNRQLLFTRIEQAITRTAEDKTVSAVIILDIDHFGKVNDAYGLAAGDQVLQQVAKRLVGHTFSRDTVSRTGGDEFTILLTWLGTNPLEGACGAVSAAEKLLLALVSEPVEIGGKPYTLHVSAGVTLILGDQTHTVADYLREADIALRRSETLRSNQVVLFQHDIQQQIEYRYSLEQDLADAVENSQLTLYMQPQFAMDGRTTGAELLARWHHPVYGSIPPSEFIPMAEATGLLGPLTCQFVKRACETILALQALGHMYPLSVNVSPETILDPLFIQAVRDILDQTGAPASRLIFEVTEEIAIENSALVTQHMRDLNACGVQFAIDDFGTGYANLAYLTTLPIHELKIDRSLIEGVPGNEKNLIVVEMILSMADRLGLRTVAEGVETRSQLDYLLLRGCDAIQGYLLARPMPIEDWLEQVGVKVS
ncbi:MAG: EAL domain-containing protein [Alcaligenaceae bacterium]|nr:EAL domain-containing protein [Alcaligenaceae bacterium]